MKTAEEIFDEWWTKLVKSGSSSGYSSMKTNKGIIVGLMKKAAEERAEEKFDSFLEAVGKISIEHKDLNRIMDGEQLALFRSVELEDLIFKHAPRTIRDRLNKVKWDKDNPVRKNEEFNAQMRKPWPKTEKEPDHRHYG